MIDEIIATDRYGGNYPDPKTACTGQCEGMGSVPIHRATESSSVTVIYEDNEEEKQFQLLWDEAEKKEPTDDGWHFVKCPVCNGTGKQPAAV